MVKVFVLYDAQYKELIGKAYRRAHTPKQAAERTNRDIPGRYKVLEITFEVPAEGMPYGEAVVKDITPEAVA